MTAVLGSCSYDWPDVLPGGDGGWDARMDGATTDATVPDGGVADADLDADLDAALDAALDAGTDASPPGCGNGIIDTGEECDDEDTDPGDGCDAFCQIEPGWYCDQEPSVCVTECGDGTHVPGEEECDDGNDQPGDGCNENCLIDCSNASITDCNYAGSTKIPTSTFVDMDPPAGFVQCAGFINTAGDDVSRHWELNCLGAVRTLRLRYWSTSTQPWVLLGDATLTPDSLATYDNQIFGATNHGGSLGVLATNGVIFLKDAPGAGHGGGTSSYECDFAGDGNDYGANDLYLGSQANDQTLWVCSGDTDLTATPCPEMNELALVDEPMGDCVEGSISATALAVAIYFQVP